LIKGFKANGRPMAGLKEIYDLSIDFNSNTYVDRDNFIAMMKNKL